MRIPSWLFSKNRILLPAIFFIGASVDLFYFQVSSDLRLFLLIALWVVVTRIYGLKSDSTFKLALGFLGLLFVFFIFNRNDPVTDKITTWIYLLLIVGVIQQFVEIKNKART